MGQFSQKTKLTERTVAAAKPTMNEGNAEDLDSRGPDHAADAVRYGCLRERHTMQIVSLGSVFWR